MIEVESESIGDPYREWIDSKIEGTRTSYRNRIPAILRFLSSEEVPEEWFDRGRIDKLPKEEMEKREQWVSEKLRDVYQTYQKTEDKSAWAKAMGRKVNQFIAKRKEEGVNLNSIRAEVMTFRSFCKDICVSLKGVQSIKSRVAIGEHKFTVQDLRKMFRAGDTREKAMLTTAVSLGWAMDDFRSLEREFLKKLVDRAKSEEMNFISFDWQRGKTGELVYGILTPESLEWLDKWLDYTEKYNNKWLWAKPKRGTRYSDTGINNIIRTLVDKSGIVTQGSVRFHLFRKFTFETLLNNGLNEYQAKLVVGKAIPSTDSAYLAQLKTQTFEKYKQAYSAFSLVTTEANGKLESLRSYSERLEKEIAEQKQRIDNLHRIIAKQDKEFREALSPEATEKRILDILHRYYPSLSEIALPSVEEQEREKKAMKRGERKIE